MTPPRVPDGYTDAQYKATLAQVIAEGRARIDQARQAAKQHLDSIPGPQVGSTESQDSGGAHD